MNNWVLNTSNKNPNLELKIKDFDQVLSDEEILIKQIGFTISDDDLFYKNNINEIPESLRSKNLIFGLSAGGYIESIGSKVVGFEKGDKIVYPFAPFGAYCEKRTIDYRYCIKIPENFDTDKAIAFLRDGLKATMLIYNVLTIQERDIILIQDVCRPVGRFISKIAKKHNLKVIGTIFTEDNYSKALNLDLDLIVNLKSQDLFSEVNIFTEGMGVRVVYDFVGKDVFEISKKVIRPFGIYVSCGYSSGIIESINLQDLRKKNLFFTAPTLELYNMTRYALIMNSAEVFDLISKNFIDNKILKYTFKNIDKIYEDIERNNINDSILVKI